MLLSAWLNSVRSRLNSSQRTKKRRIIQKQASRASEALENRSLLTSLVAVRPNVGDFLADGEVRNIAPQELTLQFSLGESIDASSVTTSSITLDRSGRDGTFDDGNEVPVSIGFIGIGDDVNEVIMRFAENLPDDTYRITVRGEGTDIVTSDGGVPFNGGVDDSFDFGLDLAPQVRAVVPMPITRTGGVLTQARNQIVVYFNEDTLDLTAAQTPAFYQLHFTNDTVQNTDDIPETPDSVAYDPIENTATLTFSGPLDTLFPPSPNASYRLRIGTSEAIPAPPSTAPVDPTVEGEIFQSDLGSGGAATITIEPNTSIDGNPITLNVTTGVGLGNGFPRVTVTGRTVDVELDDDAGDGKTTDARQLFWAINLHPEAGKLLVASQVGDQFFDVGTSFSGQTATYLFSDAGSSYADSEDLGELTSQARSISGQIRSIDYPYDFPGNQDEPGHREIDVARESHTELPPDQDREITTLTYNFQINYGFTPQGVQLSNLITENQKQRTREIFELYGKYLGVQFVETANLGFTIVTGDMRAIDPNIVTGAGNKLAHSSRAQNLAIMDAAEQWDDSYGSSWFSTAMHQIGHLLGLGHAYDLPDLTVMGGFEGPAVQTTNAEPDFPGDHDIVHGRLLYRPDSKDIDLYKFNVTSEGLFSAEIIAERQSDSSLLDSTLRLFRENQDGTRELISQNDDYFSEDAFVEVPLTVGTYYIGVSASGNNAYDPSIADTGINGTTQGAYDLRLRFRPEVSNAIVDASQNPLDGDNDGVAGGEFNFWFRAVPEAQQLIVDRIAPDGGDGSLATPYNRISDALAAASPGDVVRIVGNPGADGDFDTLDDNVAYQIGVDEFGQPLRDGLIIEIPQDVVVMVDAGALLKFNSSYIIAGSSSSVVDRSGASLQILGTPDTEVIMTSLLDETVGEDTTSTPTVPAAGNWGGVVYRRDVDAIENRLNYEDLGIFMDYVAYANISYGGGKLDIDSVQQVINPVTLIKARPGLYNNYITLSEDSAISADPDSFLESTFRTPIFQQVPFTTDYGRSGPDIYGNTLVDNSTNGLFVRVETAPGSPINKLTVPGRFDDRDIVHVITQNLEIQGTPGGPFLEVEAPPVLLVTLNGQAGGTLSAGETFNYKIVYVDAGGTTSPGSSATRSYTVGAGEGSIRLNNLPPAPTPFNGRLIYRSQDGGAGPYELIAVLNASATQFIDDGTTLSGILDESLQGRLRARTDARLAIDPNVIVKLESARIEVGMGAQLIAEGDTGRRIVFTSKLDDRFGRGGTFDTNNDSGSSSGAVPAPGNWGGIYLSPASTGSFDQTLLTFAGGVIPTDGDFAGFNAIEAHQADLRITNSIIEQNADGTGGSAPADRFGRTANAAGTIFVRGAQPVILANIVRDNDGALLTINANALNSDYLDDYGRSRGLALRFPGFSSNQGALVSDNLFGRNGTNGMVVRGETLTTQVVFDDTDIVHVVLDEIMVPDFHTYGGLRLNSAADASLVVKLQGSAAGFTAGGRPLDITDRIGGIVQIVGQPFFPVVLTSLRDDTVGSGFDLDGLPLRDTNGDGPSTGSPGDWRSVEITKFAHDRNVGVYNENEVTSVTAPGTNASAQNAEFVGELGKHKLKKIQPNETTTLEKSSDDNLRMGFEINGEINAPSDMDVYSFTGEAGMEVWIDIDRTSHAFDPVVELVSSLGQIIAQSDNSLAENNGDYETYRNSVLLQANELNKSLYLSDDWYSTNQRDAGLRVILPGVAGSIGTYFVRVRASNIDSLDETANRSDLQDNTKLLDGKTKGNYQLNIRLREADEIAGTSIKYADIRFATNGIEIYGQPVHSPLTGEFTETVVDNNDTAASSLDMGNLLNTDRAALSIAGRIEAPDDVDFYNFQVQFDDIQDIPQHTVTPRYASVVIDVDYADGMARGNTIASIFNGNGELVYVGRDSNVSDDRSGPREGADIDDLSRGSAGELDPFIGPIELPEGNYFLVVSSNDQIPVVLDQTLQANPTSTTIRLEPLPSVERIADEHFGGFGTGVAPVFDLFDNEFGQNLTPYHLGDVNVFVTTASGLTNSTQVYTIDGFTGALETQLGAFGSFTNDAAMRPDGELFAYGYNSLAQSTDGNRSQYFQIDTGTAAATNLGDDGIQTFNIDGNGNVVATDSGTRVTALTYFDATQTSGVLVATRGDGNALGYSRNIVYQFDTTTGAALGQGPDRTGDARANFPSGTQIVEVLTWGGTTDITGIANFGGAAGNWFGVNVNGQLVDLFSPGTVIATIQDQDGNPVQFQGLAAGPDEVEGGAYANMMFGIDGNGVVYAFDQTGVLQPVFVNGQTSIATGVPINPLNGTIVRSIDFGTLDRNLWDTTTLRATEAGHGLTQSQDNTRLPAPGGASLYFGNQRNGADAGNKNNLQTAAINDVNFPGGAHGSFVTNYFSLEGYSGADKPALYFNYWLETESTDYIPLVTPQLDSLRVYISSDNSTWNLLGTNDSYRGPGAFDDEQDYGLDGNPTTFPTTQTFRDVVELYDEPGTGQTWRQARVDLSHYAGRSDLRLRFEYAAAGAINVGDITTVGEEFYIEPGRRLRDGQSYIFEGVNQHEIDMGYTLVAPGGKAISVGETFTIEGVVFEFTKGGAASGGNIAVDISDTMSPQQVALAMETAIDAQLISNATHNLQTYRDNNRINLMFAPPDPAVPGPPVTNFDPFVALTQSGGAAVQVDGAPGSTSGTTDVVIHAGMSRSEAAEQVAQRFADLHLPAAAYYETEFNNARDPMAAQDLEAESWTLTPNNTITDSDTIPHISVIATSEIIGGTDFYRFVVPNNGTRVVVDIDGTSPTFSNMVQIWDNDPASVLPLFTNTGSGNQDVASNHPNDAFLDVVLDAGEYYLQVGATPGAGGAFPTQRYTVHLSVEGHAVDGGATPAAALVVPRQVVKGNNDLVRVIGHYVSTQGPMGLTTSLPGDEFGGFFSSNASLRGTANAFEGVYIDDIIIGFAERGEMVTGAPNNTTFIQNPEVNDPNNPNPYNDILEGAYDVEVRRASDFATSVGIPNGQFTAFDSNDRLMQQQTLIVANSWDLYDGMTFTLSDGVDSVVFEYEDVNVGDGVAPGHQPIFFDPIAVQPTGGTAGEPAWIVAERIRDAINSPAVQGILDVRASLSDGAASPADPSTSNRVNIYGTARFTLTDGLQDLPNGLNPPEVSGSIRQLGNSNGSVNLFSFTNESTTNDSLFAYPRWITQISMQLPAGRTFDPSPAFDPTRILTGNGPTQSPGIGTITPSFALNEQRDILDITFPTGVDGEFSSGEQFNFGIDIDALGEPIWYLGTLVEIQFSSGESVLAEFVPDGQAGNMARLRPIEDASSVDQHNAYGDANRERDQGQILIQANTISDSLNWGILSDEGFRDGGPDAPLAGNLPHAGPPRNLQEINTNRLLPGILIENNVVAHSGTGGILFSGDSVLGLLGPVPFGRIVNNTVVGNGGGTGIRVEQFASPTLLNNIVADLATGIFVDAGSAGLGTVVGTTLYRGNGTDANTSGIGLGTFPIQLGAGDPLFVDEARRNYYLAPLSQAIDSSLDVLSDRTEMNTVRSPLGISVSPIKAPAKDVFGQQRGDDPAVNTPAAQGANVFKDRGAIDRVDFFRPTAILTKPLDQAPTDLDPALNVVWINEPTALSEFIVSLNDVGIGIDDGIVSTDQFQLYQDDVLLVDGVDYVFVYNSTTNEVIFRSVTQYPFETRYRIEVDNSDDSSDGIDGVRDLAGNYLAPNQGDGRTVFNILVTDGVNDPPINDVPGNQVTDEDTDLVFSVANGNAISVSDADVRLGNNRLLVTLTAVNGVLSVNPALIPQLSFTTGDGTDDVTMMFEADVDDINAALDGLTFTPDMDYFGPASLTITTNDQGQFTGPPTPPVAPEEDTDTILIIVNPVNDPPVFDPISDPPAIQEDAGPQTVPGFMTGQVAGPPNEVPPQTITSELTVIATTGSWTVSNFFSTAPTINVVTGDLTYEVATDVNGTATVEVILRDSEGLASAPQTFVLSVGDINDEPVFTVNPTLTFPLNALEDAPLQEVDLISAFAEARATALDEIGNQPPLTWTLSSPLLISGNLAMDVLEITPAGLLRYKSAQDTAGVIQLDLYLEDGGADSPPPNDNRSTTFTFQIDITQVNDAPVAITGDYVVDEGYSLTLDGSASYDVDEFFGDVLRYEWDLDGDGTYDVGPTFSSITTLTWSQLQSLGITAPQVYDLTLRVTDTAGEQDTDDGIFTTLIVDYGDTPDSYGTLQSSGGAAHTINGTLFMGPLVDNETTGVPTGDATGDDLADLADEDGVTFTTTIEASPTLALPSFLNIVASEAGKVDAWIDFNQNGTFDHATEHLNGGVSFDVVAGDNRLEFTVPAATPIGDTFARFRISSAGGLTPTGRADDGEVEDYSVKIRPLQAPVTPVITKPVDVDPGDGRIPETSDLTPRIEWTFDDANFFYDIEVRDSGNNSVFSRTNIIDTFIDVDNNLAAGDYTVIVTAYNRASLPAADATYAFKVVPVVVSSPSGAVGTHRPVVNWNEVFGTKIYTVQIDSLTTGSTVVLTTVDPGTAVPPNQYTPTSDLPIGRYQVRVRATDDCDLPGDWSAWVSFDVKASPTVTAPTGTIDNTQRPTVTWTAVPGAISYELQLDNATDNIRPLYRVSGIPVTNWTPPADLALAQYTVWVRAYNAQGETSFWSPANNFTVTPKPVAATPQGRTPDSTPTFSWDSLTQADTYRLRVNRKFGDFGTVIDVGGLTQTIYNQMTPLPLGRYTYQVFATNNPANPAGGFTPIETSSAVYEFVVTEPPVITQPLSTTFDIRPVIEWVKPLGSGTSEIWIQQSGGLYEFERAGNLPGTSYQTTQDFPIGNYVVWVRTLSDTTPAEVSDWSIGKTFRVVTPPTLIGPTGRTPDATPTVSWNGVLGGQTYEVWIDNNSIPQPRLINEAGLNSLSYTVPSDLPIGRYTWWVRARNAFGVNSNWSTPLRFEIVTAPTLTGPPASTFDTTPSFNWNDLNGATSYDLIIEEVTNGAQRVVEQTGLTTTSYTVGTPLPVGNYKAYVRAFAQGNGSSAGGDTVGNWSSPVSFFVGGRPVVNPPGTTTDSTPTITWGAVGGANGYEIFIALASDPTNPLINESGFSSASYTVPQPLAAGEYRVWVRAINASNGSFSLWSAAASLTIADADVSTGTDAEGPLTTYAVIPAMLQWEGTTDGTVSMLPAEVHSSRQVRDERIAARLATAQPAVTTPADKVVDAPLSEAADSVLSDWDQQVWWDQQPVATPTQSDEVGEDGAAESGLMAALLALTPAALLRRRKEVAGDKAR